MNKNMTTIQKYPVLTEYRKGYVMNWRDKKNKKILKLIKAEEEAVKKAKEDGTWTHHMDEYLQGLYNMWNEIN